MYPSSKKAVTDDQSFVRSLIKLIQDVPAKKKSKFISRCLGQVLIGSEYSGQTPSSTDYLYLQ